MCSHTFTQRTARACTHTHSHAHLISQSPGVPSEVCDAPCCKWDLRNRKSSVTLILLTLISPLLLSKYKPKMCISLHLSDLCWFVLKLTILFWLSHLGELSVFFSSSRQCLGGSEMSLSAPLLQTHLCCVCATPFSERANKAEPQTSARSN